MSPVTRLDHGTGVINTRPRSRSLSWTYNPTPSLSFSSTRSPYNSTRSLYFNNTPSTLSYLSQNIEQAKLVQVKCSELPKLKKAILVTVDKEDAQRNSLNEMEEQRRPSNVLVRRRNSAKYHFLTAKPVVVRKRSADAKTIKSIVTRLLLYLDSIRYSQSLQFPRLSDGVHSPCTFVCPPSRCSYWHGGDNTITSTISCCSESEKPEKSTQTFEQPFAKSTINSCQLPMVESPFKRIFEDVVRQMKSRTIENSDSAPQMCAGGEGNHLSKPSSIPDTPPMAILNPEARDLLIKSTRKLDFDTPAGEGEKSNSSFNQVETSYTNQPIISSPASCSHTLNTKSTPLSQQSAVPSSFVDELKLKLLSPNKGLNRSPKKKYTASPEVRKYLDTKDFPMSDEEMSTSFMSPVSNESDTADVPPFNEPLSVYIPADKLLIDNSPPALNLNKTSYCLLPNYLSPIYEVSSEESCGLSEQFVRKIEKYTFGHVHSSGSIDDISSMECSQVTQQISLNGTTVPKLTGVPGNDFILPDDHEYKQDRLFKTGSQPSLTDPIMKLNQDITVEDAPTPEKDIVLVAQTKQKMDNGLTDNVTSSENSSVRGQIKLQSENSFQDPISEQDPNTLTEKKLDDENTEQKDTCIEDSTSTQDTDFIIQESENESDDHNAEEPSLGENADFIAPINQVSEYDSSNQGSSFENPTPVLDAGVTLPVLLATDKCDDHNNSNPTKSLKDNIENEKDFQVPIINQESIVHDPIMEYREIQSTKAKVSSVASQNEDNLKIDPAKEEDSNQMKLTEKRFNQGNINELAKIDGRSEKTRQHSKRVMDPMVKTVVKKMHYNLTETPFVTPKYSKQDRLDKCPSFINWGLPQSSKKSSYQRERTPETPQNNLQSVEKGNKMFLRKTKSCQRPYVKKEVKDKLKPNQSLESIPLSVSPVSTHSLMSASLSDQVARTKPFCFSKDDKKSPPKAKVQHFRAGSSSPSSRKLKFPSSSKRTLFDCSNNNTGKKFERQCCKKNKAESVPLKTQNITLRRKLTVKKIEGNAQSDEKVDAQHDKEENLRDDDIDYQSDGKVDAQLDKEENVRNDEIDYQSNGKVNTRHDKEENVRHDEIDYQSDEKVDAQHDKEENVRYDEINYQNDGKVDAQHDKEDEGFRDHEINYHSDEQVDVQLDKEENVRDDNQNLEDDQDDKEINTQRDFGHKETDSNKNSDSSLFDSLEESHPRFSEKTPQGEFIDTNNSNSTKALENSNEMKSSMEEEWTNYTLYKTLDATGFSEMDVLKKCDKNGFNQTDVLEKDNTENECTKNNTYITLDETGFSQIDVLKKDKAKDECTNNSTYVTLDETEFSQIDVLKKDDSEDECTNNNMYVTLDETGFSQIDVSEKDDDVASVQCTEQFSFSKKLNAVNADGTQAFCKEEKKSTNEEVIDESTDNTAYVTLDATGCSQNDVVENSCDVISYGKSTTKRDGTPENKNTVYLMFDATECEGEDNDDGAVFSEKELSNGNDQANWNEFIASNKKDIPSCNEHVSVESSDKAKASCDEDELNQSNDNDKASYASNDSHVKKEVICHESKELHEFGDKCEASWAEDEAWNRQFDGICEDIIDDLEESEEMYHSFVENTEDSRYASLDVSGGSEIDIFENQNDQTVEQSEGFDDPKEETKNSGDDDILKTPKREKSNPFEEFPKHTGESSSSYATCQDESFQNSAHPMSSPYQLCFFNKKEKVALEIKSDTDINIVNTRQVIPVDSTHLEQSVCLNEMKFCFDNLSSIHGDFRSSSSSGTKDTSDSVDSKELFQSKEKFDSCISDQMTKQDAEYLQVKTDNVDPDKIMREDNDDANKAEKLSQKEYIDGNIEAAEINQNGEIDEVNIKHDLDETFEFDIADMVENDYSCSLFEHIVSNRSSPGVDDLMGTPCFENVLAGHEQIDNVASYKFENDSCEREFNLMQTREINYLMKLNRSLDSTLEQPPISVWRRQTF